MAVNRLIADRYELIELIDEGGMGQVYRGRDRQTGEIVAIKVLKDHVVAQDPTLVDRFCREAVVLRKLNHPNIVRVYDTFKEDGRNYIVMEFVSGGSLSGLIRRQGALPIERAVQIALDLADALTRTHRLGVIHRDLKPGNVLLAEDGTPRLTDFGVAHVADAQTLLTQVGSLLGTIAYLSPEVSAGEAHSEKSDIWSFGMILFEMLTGHHAYQENTAAAMLTAILRKPVPDARLDRPDLPGDIAALLETLLAKDPNERIGSVREIGVELERILVHLRRVDQEQREIEATQLLSRFAPTPITPVTAVREPTGETVVGARNSLVSTPVEARTPPRGVTTPRLFIAYRREDSGEIAGRLYDQIAAILGENNIVRDVDRIADRTVSRYVLANDIVGSVDVMLVVIGPSWAGMPRDRRTASTGRAIDNPKDVMRMQIEAGLRRPDMLIIPVLVNGGALPEALPPALEGMRSRMPFVIQQDQPLDAQAQRLVKTIQAHFGVVARPRSRLVWGLVALFAVALLLMVGVALSQIMAPAPPANAPVVQPVGDGEVMVLVADFEPLRASARDATRFVLDDLAQRLEVEVPFSPIRVRHYPQVVTSSEEALARAEEVGATVVIWGNYSDDLVDLTVQTGSLESFSHNPFDRAIIDQLANVRVRLTDERVQTTAPQVLTALILLHNADGDGYELLRTMTILNELAMPSGEVVGSGTAALAHRALERFSAAAPEAVQTLDAAIALEGGNPLLYLFRALARQRIGDFAGSAQDLGTAQRLAPESWLQPYYLIANTATYTRDYPSAVAAYDRIVAGRPEDWFPLNYRGALHYLTGDYAAARRDLDSSIALKPNANFPYPFATLIAMRDGRISDARALMRTVLREFPDPAFANRTLQALYGQDDAIIWGPFFAAYTNLILGQYDSVIADVQRALSLRADLADLYLLEGLAYCSLGDHAQAEVAYTSGLEIEPGHPVLLVLRAESRAAQGAIEQGTADLNAALAMDLGEEFEAMATSERITCANFFSSLAGE
ncbi:MAG: protein kinase [Anaerolineae bacterium]|nr:protein kinase [Anaerolineae bacterium]NUQ03646.1 protein kinase [Anaerolineae bacterium]